MRVWLSILLLAVFLTAQYARQFAYLQCRLANQRAAGLQGCDCGQATNIAQLADDGHPATRGHVHLTLDEFFTPPVHSQAPAIGAQPPKPFTVAHTAPLLQGCNGSIDRPPQS
jgi:hypothetical protein